MLKNLKISVRLWGGFASIILLALVWSAYALNSLDTLSQLTLKLYDHPLAVSNAVLSADGHIIKMHRSMKDVALAQTEEEIIAAAREVDNHEKMVLQDFRIVQDRFLGDKKKINQLILDFKNWKAIRTEVIALMRAGKHQEAAIITKGKGAVYVKNLNEHMAQLIAFARNKADEFIRNSEQQRTITKDILWAFLGLIVFMGAGISFLITRGITIPLGQITTASEKLAHGDYTVTLPQRTNDEIGTLAASFATMRTAIRNKEEALQTSEEKFRRLVEKTSAIAWEFDISTWLFTYVSPQAVTILGYPQEDWFQKNFWADHIHPDDYQTAVALHMACIEQGEDHDFEYRMIAADGRSVWVHDLISVYFHDGKVTKLGGFMFDISARKLAEAKLHDAMVAADRANMAKSEFLSSMSHELRTPLNGILGFAQLLQYDPDAPLNTTQKDRTEQIIKSGDHLLLLINQVLELAKIEAGKISVSLEKLNIRTVVEECIPLIKTAARQRNIELVVHNDSDLFVYADHTRLIQVILNLLSNAVKYNCDDGTITLSVTKGANDKVRVSVADTGFGISDAHKKSLFEPFERLGHEASEIEGTGIGLTITRELAHLMAGEIGFESEQGKGSTFWIEVSSAKGEDKGASTKTQNDVLPPMADIDIGHPFGDPSRTYVVLYVEDNPANTMLVEQIFHMIPNLNLLTSQTADLGLEMARSYHPDLILMDIHLPGMSGIEALGRLQNKEATRDIPVVAVTADAMPHQIKSGLKLGFQAYITKPFKVQPFLQTIRDALDLTAV